MKKAKFIEISKKEKRNKNLLKDCLIAFLGGGLLGLLSQGLIDLYHLVFEVDYLLSFSLSSITLVLLAAILTSLSFYNDLGQIFGAGLFIPITGFSNSMVSASIEGKSEGLIYGIGTNLFSLAGSVICYGIGTSVIVSLIYYVLLLMGVRI
ncbi:MAG: SpoVA/SpoVAEb family sporulation membrane protein [Erysipelotrichaceae bacterium]|nr:SpoVA/SpoVAEb family sporulation membrane protein [Erysipelotrichaceae bacterium]